MNQETENFLSRRELWLRQATQVIKANAPLLNDSQAREVAIIAMKSWQDLRSMYEWVETNDFLMTL